MAIFYGRAGRSTAQNGGVRPGQDAMEELSPDHAHHHREHLATDVSDALGLMMTPTVRHPRI
jgi:hypothetical protein